MSNNFNFFNMKKNVFILLAIAATIFVACESITNLSDSNTDNSSLTGTALSTDLKSSEVATSETAENALEELSYEAEFYAESEHLLRMLTRTRGLKQILRGQYCERYNNGVAPDISIDTAEEGYPIVITIDYGDSTGITSGRNITGVVTIEITGSDTTDGATRTITLTDCVVDTVTINGELIRTFNGDDSTRIITKSSDVTFTINDTTEYHRTGEYVHEWLSGLDTPMDHRDDEIQVTGTTTITNQDGVTWERTITDPLLKIADCRNYVQGTIDITQDGTVLATIDYGDGECDNIATITTSDGEVIEIVLKVGKGGGKHGHGGEGHGGDHGKHGNH